MFCSTIIPTIGRPELDRAVTSVLSQDFATADFEVIVVNDSGRTLRAAEWQQSRSVQIIDTNRHERSIARNTGAAIAKGTYLHFLDDDDWLIPGALKTFWQLTRQYHGDWFYGGTQLVDREEQPIICLDHQLQGNAFVQVMAGEWIPLQSSLIANEAFFAAGGFNPHIAGPEDVDLCRRILQHGNIVGSSEVVSCIGMGETGSSTDYARSPRQSRWARERILNEPGTFRRLQTSAHQHQWQGRILRIYLTSMVWNLRQGYLGPGAHRFGMVLLSLLQAGSASLTGNYWQSVLKAYESPTFLRGFQRANRPVERRQVKAV